MTCFRQASLQIMSFPAELGPGEEEQGGNEGMQALGFTAGHRAVPPVGFILVMY